MRKRQPTTAALLWHGYAAAAEAAYLAFDAPLLAPPPLRSVYELIGGNPADLDREQRLDALALARRRAVIEAAVAQVQAVTEREKRSEPQEPPSQ